MSINMYGKYVTKYLLVLPCGTNSIFARICYPALKNHAMLQFHMSYISLFFLLHQEIYQQPKPGCNSRSPTNSEQLKKSISTTYPTD